MGDKLILLPGADNKSCRILRMPEDMDDHEAFRNVTGIIAGLEERDGVVNPEDLDDALEDHGFVSVDYIVGPGIG